MPELAIQPRYTRSDPRGLFPVRTGLPELEHNRLAVFWRPLIDMADSPFAPLRLRAVPVLADRLADPAPGRWVWLSMIGVPGLRHQVLRHAGLDHYDCRDPRDLAEDLRSPRWNALLDAMARFAELDFAGRALVVFLLAQLSYPAAAVRLAGDVTPTGDPGHDRYAYEVIRVRARVPGQNAFASAAFREMASVQDDPRLVLAACFQGLGRVLRGNADPAEGEWFRRRGAAVAGLDDGWHTHLVRSRFHRAVGLLELTRGDRGGARRELRAALRHDAALAGRTGVDAVVAAENRRYLLELSVRIGGDDVRARCDELVAADPHCVEALLLAGDGYAAIGDYGGAARWYSAAGELGTGSGAVGWFRAAQCLEHVGDRGGALNAMGRCLELDHTAVEARDYLDGRR
ncbi:hypothetical protein [Saccharothrix lopnurensis]|uniref:Tetratricopeptide repeat protein n=1 Tax=Saccharothrix lopnurensis TaxID=1670621 RepID=A0ABW1P9E7_9PSEU